MSIKEIFKYHMEFIFEGDYRVCNIRCAIVRNVILNDTHYIRMDGIMTDLEEI